MTRDAFHRQDALHRIRWSLRPRSHDRHTAFATGRPLNGALAPPWATCRCSPHLSG